MESCNAQDTAPAMETTEMRIVTLPTEIYACIIDCLSNIRDAGTIANCALVCRAWLPFSRHKLYSEVRLWYRLESIRFKEVLLCGKPEASSGYLSMMQTLVVWPRDEQFFDEGQTRPRIGWEKGQERSRAHVILIQCARRLTGLTYIRMLWIGLSPSHPIAIRSGQYYRCLTRLGIYGCTFTGILQLQSFVTSFPVLSDLTLHLVELHSRIVPRHFPKGGHPLTRLELGCNCNMMLATTRWLDQAKVVRNLEYLHWSSFEVEKAEEDWKTLANAIDGHSLQELHFIVSYLWQVDFSRFASLKHLSLKLYFNRYNIDERTPTSILVSILSTVASHQLETLDLDHVDSATQSLDSILTALSDLKDVDAILSSPKFRYLRCTCFYFQIFISMQKHPVASNAPPPTSSNATLLASDLSSLPGLDDNDRTDNPEDTFRHYAEDFIRSKIREELKQLNSRGILDIRLHIFLREEKTSDVTADTEARRGIEDPAVDPSSIDD